MMDVRTLEGDVEDAYSSYSSCSDDEHHTLLDPLAEKDTGSRLERGHSFSSQRKGLHHPSLVHRCTNLSAAIWHALKSSSSFHVSPLPRSSRLRSRTRRACRILPWALLAILTLSTFAWLVPVFSLPSFVTPPQHYHDLRLLAQASTQPGRGNPSQEKVFIAAILHDPTGELLSGPYAQNILDLVDLLGPQNTFLSIFESDSGEVGRIALESFRAKVACEHEIVAVPAQPLDDIQVFSLPNGDRVVRRIEYLAKARNRALEPLNRPGAVRYDRILYLNDVIFDPVEAVQLLFSTNVQEDGRAEYDAACAMDFKNPFIYYDTFATKDFDGYAPGLPMYPWFSGEGSGLSRRDVLKGTDHVRVKSCWGGMVAFDASFFQQQSNNDNNDTIDGPNHDNENIDQIVHFRNAFELGWEYSECCLIYADKAAISIPAIYLNPFIRVAYSTTTFTWLPLLRRLERIFLPLQVMINHFAHLPTYNERRDVAPDDLVMKRVWAGGNATTTTSDDSNDNDAFLDPANCAWKEEKMGNGGFCGIQATFVLKLEHGAGKDVWVKLPDDPLRGGDGRT